MSGGTILADTSDTRDFLKLFLWQAEGGSRPTRRHPRDDPREDVGEDVGFGVVECDLILANVLQFGDYEVLQFYKLRISRRVKLMSVSCLYIKRIVAYSRW